MNIMMVASEAVPWAKTGGLADVTSALSRALANRGHQVTIFLPRYGFINCEECEELPLVPEFTMGFQHFSLRLLKTRQKNSKVSIIFLDHPFFSERQGLYGENGSHTYRDNHLRFALLSRAAVETAFLLSMNIDIFHIHDWQAATLPAYLTEYGKGSTANAKTLFTIHNIGYQGIFSKQDLQTLGLEWDAFSRSRPAYKDSVNFLASAILNSDHITTVSPTYAKEITTAEFGEGLENLLLERKNAISGILNGVDYQEWNPEHDPYIPVPFSAEEISGKAAAKKALQESAGLTVDPSIPLIGMVGRLAEQKGFVELLDPERGALRRILEESPVQIVILGTGSSWIEARLLELSKSCSSMKLFLTFSEDMAHLIEAGSDFFLMPSTYEPCGLNQIYSLRYGTIPIVRATGGLADTVVPYDNGDNGNDGKTGLSTGFVFRESNPDKIVETVRQALELWRIRPEIIEQMQQRGMAAHFSWDDSAIEYEKLYSVLQQG